MASVEDSPAADFTKKRAAARQISKDDDPDAEEEASVEGATFKKAPDAVLNNRRIVKVRRAGGAAAAAPAGANPFASIRLVPPPAESKPAEAAPEEDKSKDSSTVVAEESKQPVSEPGTEPAAEKDTKDEVADSAPVTNGEKAAVDDVASEKAAAAVGSSGLSADTFQQLSSAKNAFSASFGTGFSTTPVASSTGFGSGGFTFGSAPAFGSTLSGSGSGSPFGSSVFGAANGSSSTFQLFGSGTAGTAAAAAAAAPAAAAPAITPLQEVHVESGEEKEKTVFAADASLFEFLDGGWNERGKGEVKVNVPEDTSRRPRLVMRGKGNLRLLLNANILPNMKITKMDNRGVTFVCANAIGDGKVGLATFALKLRDAQFARDFLSTVEAKKGKSSAEPPTPETSPKAAAAVSEPEAKAAPAAASDEAVKTDDVEAAAAT